MLVKSIFLNALSKTVIGSLNLVDMLTVSADATYIMVWALTASERSAGLTLICVH